MQETLQTWVHPWVRQTPWRKKWQLLQYSCLENSVDRGAWQATVHEAAESDMTEQPRTQFKIMLHLMVQATMLFQGQPFFFNIQE